MAFGFNQIGKPTPATATWVFRIVLYLASLASAYAAMDADIAPAVLKKIVLISSFATMAVHLASKMFGIPLPEDASVPAKDVASLNTDQPEIKN